MTKINRYEGLRWGQVKDKPGVHRLFYKLDEIARSVEEAWRRDIPNGPQKEIDQEIIGWKLGNLKFGHALLGDLPILEGRSLRGVPREFVMRAREMFAEDIRNGVIAKGEENVAVLDLAKTARVASQRFTIWDKDIQDP